MRTYIRESYFAKLWLTGEAIAFLNAEFPDDEYEVAIAKLVDRSMRQATKNKRSLQSQIEQLESELAERNQTIARLQNELAISSEVRKTSPENNPINHLQEVCQAQNEPLPQYSYGSCSEGIWCECSALGYVATGVGRTNKIAKRDAAIALLEILG